METQEKKVTAFLKKVESLDIEVSVNAEGVFTACSANEPHFCFDGYSQAEVADRVIHALSSYAKLYYDLEGLELRSNRQDIPEPTVKLEAPRPVSKLALAVA